MERETIRFLNLGPKVAVAKIANAYPKCLPCIAQGHFAPPVNGGDRSSNLRQDLITKTGGLLKRFVSDTQVSWLRATEKFKKPVLNHRGT